MGEPAAHQWQGKFFQLDDILGVERENGLTLNTRRYNVEEHRDHFILADAEGEVDFGEGKKNIVALDGTTAVHVYMGADHTKATAPFPMRRFSVSVTTCK